MLQRDRAAALRRLEEPPPSATISGKPGASTRAEHAAPMWIADEPREPAAVRARRLLDWRDEQLARLGRALTDGEYLAARSAAETLRALEPTTTAALEQARVERAEPAQALIARAEAQAQIMAPLLAQAPASEPGLGIDLLDPYADANKQESWRALHKERSAGRRANGTAPLAVAPDHDGFEAAMDHRVPLAAQAGQPLAALAYVHLHMREVRLGLAESLVAGLGSAGDPSLRFARGPAPFVAALLAPLDPQDGSACIALLRRWLAPLVLADIVDRNRAITAPAIEAKASSYAAGPRGPATWLPAVAAAIGAALLERLGEAMPRVGRRLVAAVRARGGRGPALAGVTTRDVVPASALDAAVVRAFVGGAARAATVELSAEAARSGGEAVRHRRVRSLQWQGGNGGPWNAVRALDPADAGPEEVAFALWGSWAEASKLRRIGDVFLVEEQEAARFSEAAQHRPKNGHPSAEALLAFGPSATAAVRAELARVSPRADVPPPGAAALRSAWLRLLEQLRALDRVATEHGLPGELAGAIAWHLHRGLDLETVDGDAAVERAESFAQSRRLVSEIAEEVGALLGGLPRRHSGAKPSTALRDLIRAAAFAHLPETGRRLLAEARASRRASVLDGVEAMLGQIASTLARVSALGPHARSANARVTAALGESMTERLTALQKEAASRRGAGELAHLPELLQRAEELRREAEVVLQLGALGQAFAVLDELEDSGWVLFSEAVTAPIATLPEDGRDGASPSDGGRIGRLEALRVGAFELRAALGAAHARWLRVSARARALAPQLASTAGAPTAALVLLKLEAELFAARADLGALSGNDRVRGFLEHAAATARSAQRRAMVTQIVALIGVMIASGSAAAAAEGVAAGAGASTLTTQLVGLAAETVVFSALDARLNQTPLARQLAHDFVTNLATFGAMRATKATLAGHMAKLTGAHLPRGVVWAAKAGEISATTITAAGVSYAAAQAQSLAARGRALSLEEQRDLAVQGMAMMIGGAILHHKLTRSLASLRDKSAGAVESHLRSRQLAALAKRVAQRGDAAEALDLIRRTREHLQAELAASPEAASKKATDASAAAPLEQLARIEAAVTPAQLGLEAVIPGQVFAGTEAQLAPVVAAYRSRGYQVRSENDGYIVERPGEVALRLWRRADALAAPARPAPPSADGGAPTTPHAAPRADGGEHAAPRADGAEHPAPRADGAELAAGLHARRTAPMAAIDPVQLEVARIRGGEPGRIRDVLALNDSDVALALNHQLRAISAEQLGELWASFGADAPAAREVLTRASGFATMESWNALVTAMQPHLAAGKRLYVPGRGSLADNLSYTASKGQYADLPRGPARIPSTESIIPGAIVVLDSVVLHDIRSDAAFARSLVNARCTLIEPKGMLAGINLYNSPNLETIAHRTRELLKRARATATAQRLSFEAALELELGREARETLAAAAPELMANIEVVDAAAHPALSDAALARQLSGNAGISPDELAGVLEPFSEQDRAFARELLVHQAEVISPRRLADDLAQAHTQLLARAAEHGVAADKVYFYIPERGKSYGMVAMAHRESTKTPVDRYIDGRGDLKARKLSPDHLLIVLDDVAGSGHSLEDSVNGLRRSGFTGRVLVAPIVSTEHAKELFDGMSETDPGLEYQPRAMSRALKESFFFKSLQPEDQAHLIEDLIGDSGYSENALSLSFSYMSPDNNNAFFGHVLSQYFITNRNQRASKAKPYRYPIERHGAP